ATTAPRAWSNRWSGRESSAPPTASARARSSLRPASTCSTASSPARPSARQSVIIDVVLPGIVACIAFGALAIFGGETGRKSLVRIGKPLATLALLLVVGFPPWDRFQTLVVVGILFSLAGDIALLGDGDREFLIGTVAFLIAHVCYIIAFVGAVPG